MSVAERFWSKVDIREEDECWPWLAQKHRQGYGFFKLKKINKLAHRVSYNLTHGTDLPSSIKILHECDNPPCCNPKHLRVGTQRDNVEDMIRKGRRGWKGKLTPEQVVAVYDDQRCQRVISVEYGIHNSEISRIKSGKKHGKITGVLGREPGRPLRPPPMSGAEIQRRVRAKKRAMNQLGATS